MMMMVNMKLMVFVMMVYLSGTCRAKPELQLLNIIFRHGDRTPTAEAIFPTDPNYHNNFYPIGHGGLTNSGKLRMYKLGEYLHDKYKEFATSSELVFARTTDYSRTKMSLQLVLAALFPPLKTTKIWHERLNWMPVPFSYVPKSKDDLLATTSQARYLVEKERITLLPEIQERFKNLSEFMVELSNLTGTSITGSFDMTQVYDTLLSESMMNLTLPSWAPEMFPDGRLYEAALLFYDIITYDDMITDSISGKLMLKIQKDMLDKERRKKVFLYSAHETNIVGVLRALNIYETHIPFYSSAVIIELWKDAEENFVKVLYYLGNSTTAIELQLPNCPILCPLDKYTSNLKNILQLAEKHETSKPPQ